ncbi:hypothetical protein LCGC14_2600310 [marine sediment metagenome]|uniref:Uncharacterized protein n=1 Tax=marine sediment metagenome TaxID=412755 RepID=A0A0F9AWN0_9ZZZZ
MISALERLRALRTGKSLDLPALTDIDDLPIDWRIEYEERAAILEYDGEFLFPVNCVLASLVDEEDLNLHLGHLPPSPRRLRPK